MNTVKQARETWCPMVRFNPIGADEAYQTHTTRGDSGSNCIADQCAAWRWEPVTGPANGERLWRNAPNPDAHTEDEAGPKPEECNRWHFCPCDTLPAGWIEPQSSADARRQGYCGLAGRPITA